MKHAYKFDYMFELTSNLAHHYGMLQTRELTTTVARAAQHVSDIGRSNFGLHGCPIVTAPACSFYISIYCTKELRSTFEKTAALLSYTIYNALINRWLGHFETNKL